MNEIERLESIKKEINTPELKKVIDQKINKLKSKQTIYKDGN